METTASALFYGKFDLSVLYADESTTQISLNEVVQPRPHASYENYQSLLLRINRGNDEQDKAKHRHSLVEGVRKLPGKVAAIPSLYGTLSGSYHKGVKVVRHDR